MTWKGTNMIKLAVGLAVGTFVGLFLADRKILTFRSVVDGFDNKMSPKTKEQGTDNG